MTPTLPDIPVPRATQEVRDRNERRSMVGAQGRCLICEAPLVGKLLGLNVDLASFVVMDPEAPDRPGAGCGVQWVGAACARKVPAAYRIPWGAQ